MALLKNRSIPEAVVVPVLAYRDVGEAVTWLCEKFGFRERLRIGNHRAQLTFDGGAIVVAAREGSGQPGVERVHSIMVRVPDAVRHHAHAAAAGAKVLRGPEEYPYGERQYSVEDIGGHLWTFSETMADRDPASWGGILRAES
jgi:uncharacterized glyoxalase superfamily protein PhnB